MLQTSICALGQGAPLPMRSAFCHWLEMLATLGEPAAQVLSLAGTTSACLPAASADRSAIREVDPAGPLAMARPDRGPSVDAVRPVCAEPVDVASIVHVYDAGSLPTSPSIAFA
jgi:hypothetical protein